MRESLKRNSSILPGQPWRKIKGIAVGDVENKARKWMVKSEPSGSVMGIVKFGNELIFSSHLLLKVRHVLDYMLGPKVGQGEV